METIILNGKIGGVDTFDEADRAIGIIEEKRVKTFGGEENTIAVSGYPIAPKMNSLCGWKKFACVNFYLSDKPIDSPEKAKEEYIKSIVGGAEVNYHHMHTSLTGYIGTRSEFKVGNHDILAILKSHIGEYIHMEIKIYNKDELPKELEQKIKEINK
jgi:hypothetical protein